MKIAEKSTLFKKMDWPPHAGLFVLAVSGGVDSMSLLHLFANSTAYDVEVAHFNHGWSDLSDSFEEVVRAAAAGYGLKFHVTRQTVPPNENEARKARYAFLRSVKDRSGARAIITAHHFDDLAETVLFNIGRGTGRLGLTPFRSVDDIVRPLKRVKKSDLIAYARQNDLRWVEDPSNQDELLARNRIRSKMMPLIDPTKLEAILAQAQTLNRAIDQAIKQKFSIKEYGAEAGLVELRRMNYNVLTEVLAAMVREVLPGSEVHRRTIEELAVDIKTGRFRTERQLTKQLFAYARHDKVTIAFIP